MMFKFGIQSLRGKYEDVNQIKPNVFNLIYTSLFFVAL